MQFFRRPGFIATSALLVLLVLSRKNIVPIDAVFVRFTETFVTPFMRLQNTPRRESDREVRELRSLLRRVVGEQTLATLNSKREDGALRVNHWAQLRTLPPPILANVLTRMEEGGESFYLLERGERDGVQFHAAVTTGDGILVGRIVRVNRTTSLLRLLTASRERFSVMREKESGAIGIVEGRGNDAILDFLFVPRDITIARDDVVVTSGLDPFVPAHLLVGVVRDSGVAQEGPWQHVTVDPFMRPTDLLTVGILTFPE